MSSSNALGVTRWSMVLAGTYGRQPGRRRRARERWGTTRAGATRFRHCPGRGDRDCVRDDPVPEGRFVYVGWGSVLGARGEMGRRRRRAAGGDVGHQERRDTQRRAGSGASRRVLPRSLARPRRRRPLRAGSSRPTTRPTATRWRVVAIGADASPPATRQTPWSWRCPNRNRPPTRTLDHAPTARNRTFRRGRRRIGGLSRTPHSLGDDGRGRPATLGPFASPRAGNPCESPLALVPLSDVPRVPSSSSGTAIRGSRVAPPGVSE